MQTLHTKVYTTSDGRTVIEQSSSSVVVLSADQILTVIDALRACYDYCAVWKRPVEEEADRPMVTEIQR